MDAKTYEKRCRYVDARINRCDDIYSRGHHFFRNCQHAKEQLNELRRWVEELTWLEEYGVSLEGCCHHAGPNAMRTEPELGLNQECYWSLQEKVNELIIKTLSRTEEDELVESIKDINTSTSDRAEALNKFETNAQYRRKIVIFQKEIQLLSYLCRLIPYVEDLVKRCSILFPNPELLHPRSNLVSDFIKILSRKWF